MNDEAGRWPRVKAIFNDALNLPSRQRAAFLHDACGSDSGLRTEVESLLAAHAEAGSFAEGDAMDAFANDVQLTASLPPALAASDELGAYHIVGPLDAGGMGEVYRAIDTRLEREVAVKVLPAALSDDPHRVARLSQEARILAALNHPGIATIHGLEIAGRRQAIVMELVEGPTLAERLAGGPLPVDETLEVAREVASALEAAHSKGIVHRDLKPANIKFTHGGAVKVLDFGLAKAASAVADGTESGLADGASRRAGVAGTPAYMSPEQASGLQEDARSDIWAFGCVLYEMLTAHRVSDRAAFTESMPAAGEQDPDWTRLPPTVPAGVRRLLRRCLVRDPAKRLHHIADARIELEDAQLRIDDTVADVAGKRSIRLLTLTSVGLALALIVALAFVWRPSAVGELRVAEITTPRTHDLWSFALSPDGRQLTFVADHQGQPKLWVRTLDSTEAQPLAGTERARRPFWSPDSRSIGFFADSQMKRVESRGGPPQVIAYALGESTAAWGPDGTILFSSVAAPTLRRVDAAGGPVEPATAATPDSTGHRHPQFIAGTSRFLFFVGGSEAVRGVYLGELGSLEATRLVASDAQGEYQAGRLLFVRQGTLLAQRIDLDRRRLDGEAVSIADSVAVEPTIGAAAYSTSGGAIAFRKGIAPSARLTWFDRSGHQLGVFGSPEQAGAINPSLSPDDSRVIANRTLRDETDVWLLDGTRQTRLTHTSGRSITRLPLWSHDGERLAFESVRSSSVTLSAMSPGGDGVDEVLVESPLTKIPNDWSPDGRSLIYYVPDPTTGTDLWVLPLDTRRPRIFLQTEANELWAQFSPDGRWVAFQSNATGRYEIYVRPFDGQGGNVPVSTAGGVYPRWSRDGQELYFIAPDARMMASRIRATTTTLKADLPVPLFATQKLGGGQNVIANGHQYDVASDGRFLINVDTEASAPPIVLMMNWRK